jgi:hypothetical protein
MNPVQGLLNVIIAAASVITVTYLTKRRTYPVEAVFDAGMDYQRRLTRRAEGSDVPSMALAPAADQ